MVDHQAGGNRRAPAGEADWLTLGQAAAFLGVAQSTIRKWSDQGRVPAFLERFPLSLGAVWLAAPQGYWPRGVDCQLPYACF